MISQPAPDGRVQPGGDPALHRIRSYRFLIVLPFAISATLLVPLAFLHRPSEIEISVSASRMSFQTQAAAAGGILTSIPVISLTLQGFGNVDLRSEDIQVSPRVDVPVWRTVSSHPSLSVTGLSPTASLTLHHVTLDGLSFPARSSLSFLTDRQNPRSVAVRVSGGAVSGSISGGKQLEMLCDACQITDDRRGGGSRVGMLRLRSAKPHVIDFRGRAEGLAIGFEPSRHVDIVEQRIPVTGDLRFITFEPGRQISTISAGTLRLPEFGARKIDMSGGDFLIVNGLHGFEVKVLKFSNGMQAVLHGRAETLASGPAGYITNRLPSWLDWVYTRQSWTLYLNALILAATTIWGVIKRLKLVHDEGGRCDNESS